jgi:hypothetical protein
MGGRARVGTANARSAGFEVTYSPKLRRFRPDKLYAWRFWTLSLAVGVLMTLGCGTPHATLEITAPATVTAGTPFTITVTAIYEGKRDTVINSFVHFTSSDSAAVLPADYRFTAADAGSHTWPNGVTLMTPGSQTITATMYMAAGITGTAPVTVSSASLTRSGVSPPATAARSFRSNSNVSNGDCGRKCDLSPDCESSICFVNWRRFANRMSTRALWRFELFR